MFRFLLRRLFHAAPSSAPSHPRLSLEALDGRDIPALLTGTTVVVGADAGAPPVVRVIDPSNQNQIGQFLAFESTFTGGVRVAVADVNGDGTPDLIAGAGSGGGPSVKVFDGKDGSPLSAFFAYAPSFTGGVSVAGGDLDGDGKAEVITGAGTGGGPQVSVFDGTTGALRASTFAYDVSLRNGVRVAAGDTDGDGKAEVVTGPGVGGGPDVRVFKWFGGGDPLRSVGGFFAFAPSFTGGVNVAAGDVDGDGRAEVIAGAGAGGGPQVSVFTADGRPVASFFAYPTDFRGGVRVATADLTGDGKAEVITGAGPGGGPQVNVYSLPSTAPAGSLLGLPSDQTGGTFVAGSSESLTPPFTADFVVNDAYAQVKALIEQQKEAAAAAAQAAAEAARQNRVLYYPVLIDNTRYVYPFYPGFGLGSPFFYPGFGGYGFAPFYGPYLGLGLGLGFGGGGLGLGGGTVFYDDPGYYYDPGTYVDPGYYYDPGYVDPGFYYEDPGYYYEDPGFYDDGGFSDPGYYDDGGYYDTGFYDDGGFYDF